MVGLLQVRLLSCVTPRWTNGVEVRRSLALCERVVHFLNRCLAIDHYVLCERDRTTSFSAGGHPGRPVELYVKYRPPLCITTYRSVLVFTDSSLAFLNRLRRRLLNMTFSLLPGQGVVFVHLAMAYGGDPNPLVTFASSALFCTGSRFVKHWWGVTGFQCAISGTTFSLDIILRDGTLLTQLCSCPNHQTLSEA